MYKMLTLALLSSVVSVTSEATPIDVVDFDPLRPYVSTHTNVQSGGSWQWLNLSITNGESTDYIEQDLADDNTLNYSYEYFGGRLPNEDPINSFARLSENEATGWRIASSLEVHSMINTFFSVNEGVTFTYGEANFLSDIDVGLLDNSPLSMFNTRLMLFMGLLGDTYTDGMASNLNGNQAVDIEEAWNEFGSTGYLSGVTSDGLFSGVSTDFAPNNWESYFTNTGEPERQLLELGRPLEYTLLSGITPERNTSATRDPFSGTWLVRDVDTSDVQLSEPPSWLLAITILLLGSNLRKQRRS